MNLVFEARSSSRFRENCSVPTCPDYNPGQNNLRLVNAWGKTLISCRSLQLSRDRTIRPLRPDLPETGLAHDLTLHHGSKLDSLGDIDVYSFDYLESNLSPRNTVWALLPRDSTEFASLSLACRSVLQRTRHDSHRFPKAALHHCALYGRKFQNTIANLERPWD